MARDDRTTAQKLRDAYLLHALFLEGVRNWQAGLFKPTKASIIAAIRALLASMPMQFQDTTKADLIKLAALIRAIMTRELSLYKLVLLGELQSFVGTDVSVFNFILATITGISFDDAVAASRGSMYGPLAATDSQDGNAKLWAILSNAVIPASGLTLAGSIDVFNSFATAQVMRALNRSYANNEDTNALESDLFGDDLTDGVLDRLDNAAKTVGSSAFAFASAGANQAVSSLYYGKYQWCSVMDSRTTEICQSRNDEVYVYGEGPTPPAHENCRSTVIPYEENSEVDTTQSFTDWVDGLPPDVVDEVFSNTEQNASAINPTHAKPLSVDDFASKQTAMLQ